VLDPPSIYGDPTFAETAFYDLWLTIPNGWTIAATGTETPIPPLADTTTWHLVSGPVREFSLVIDDDFVTASRMTGETTVTIYTDGSGTARAGAEIALAEAIVALEQFSALLGPYPYRELDLVETEMNGAIGIAWTGLIFLNGAKLLSSSYFVNDYPALLRFTVDHEVGHQWLGALVGMNSNNHSFLLEGWTNYLSMVVVERSEGVAAGQDQLLVQAVNPYLRTLETVGDGIADVPISSDAPNPSRGVLIYAKTALGALAIRQEIGDEAFFAALLAWSEEFTFGIASPESLLAAFEELSGVQLDELWSFWFLEANTRVEDVHALLE
jgi:aminopeptidase N